MYHHINQALSDKLFLGATYHMRNYAMQATAHAVDTHPILVALLTFFIIWNVLVFFAIIRQIFWVVVKLYLSQVVLAAVIAGLLNNYIRPLMVAILFWSFAISLLYQMLRRFSVGFV